MPLMRRRPLMGAAMVGGTAYVAGKAGAKAGAAAQQPQAAPPPAQPAPEPAAAPPAAPAPQPAAESTTEKMAELEQLKRLLDAGVLTQAEFDAQKLRILSSL